MFEWNFDFQLIARLAAACHAWFTERKECIKNNIYLMSGDDMYSFENIYQPCAVPTIKIILLYLKYIQSDVDKVPLCVCER